MTAVATKANPEQLAAIDATGPVFVSAGAGTGKTTVLVERFVRAVCERGLDLESVLVITYTERAAGELRGRIRARLIELGRIDLARELDGAWISTIHGFCLRLLKSHPFPAGLDPRFRVLDDSQARVLRGEAFEAALDEFCAGDEPDRLQLLTTYTARGLRRMLTGVYERLRSAGRELVLELGERPGLAERLEELRDAARCLADDESATEAPRAQAARALDLLERRTTPELLLDLSDLRTRGERAATFEEARKAAEQAALDELALRDRDLLQELLDRFAEAYAEVKRRESALDFEDLQLTARDLLRDHPDLRRREAWRFRAIMVDEFQDTNRLQCELIDLLSRPWPATAPAGQSRGSSSVAVAGDELPLPWPPPDAAASDLERPATGPVLSRTVPSGPAPPAAPQEREGPALEPTDMFFVGDEFQSIYGFRHADVAVFRERRAQSPGLLALSQNYRSRPELLAVVNHLFKSDFGDEFQPLAASRDFPDPVFGTPVELLVTDKASYADSGLHWRRAEARHVARRVQELVAGGIATPGEIVLLFAAGTDAEWYEEELRAAGLPTYRATGRGYFGQQQVVDLLGYLRLLHNRYDDEALVTVLASPFVGVSNDALVLLRRAAPKRPLFTALERGLPEALEDRDAQLCRAFLQRYERLIALSSGLSLERLCEQVVAEHDYDLAVLAQWDGKRRYANLRKLARLARSYEELRGADVEGFVRFVREQEAVGAREVEAVAEEEGTDAVRLLTIHAAKGLEFKVVVVADAGRERAAPGSDEILALPDGRFGFRVADPSSGRRRGAFGYEEVKEAERRESEAERRRLYYVGMTRAIERLIVSGSIDGGDGDSGTPIGWVLGRLDAHDVRANGDEPVEIEREGARLVIRLDRFRPQPTVQTEAEPAHDLGQLSLFEADTLARALPPAPELPPLAPVPAPPLHQVRRLSYSALSLFERCSYRYYAERVVGMRPADAGGHVPGQTGLAATEIGDAVHVLLEHVELSAPVAPDADGLAASVRARYPAATDDELERIRAFVSSYCESELAGRIARLGAAAAERPFAFEHDGVLLHGRFDVLHREGGQALVLDYKTNSLAEGTPEEIVESEYRLQRLVYALACFRAGVDEVEVVYHFLERPDAVVSTSFRRADAVELEAELSRAITQIQEGRFMPTPSEFTCAACPVLDVVCAGPRLGNGGPAATRALAAAR